MLWPLAIGAAYSPSSRKVVQKMLNMAEVNADDVVYDLGSGDGRIVIEAAQKYHVLGVGVEADPLRVIWSRLKIIRLGLGQQVKIIWGNLFHQNIGPRGIHTGQAPLRGFTQFPGAGQLALGIVGAAKPDSSALTHTIAHRAGIGAVDSQAFAIQGFDIRKKTLVALH